MWLIQPNQMDNGLVSLKDNVYLEGSYLDSKPDCNPRLPHVKIVHYPDCQQLGLWLPDDRLQYKDITVKRVDVEELWLQDSIDRVVQGRVQLILDTHPWPKGEYSIKISANDGSGFYLTFEKSSIESTKEIIAKPDSYSESSSGNDNYFKIYKDGWGNDIILEDAIIREKAFQSLKQQFSRKLKFESYGRDGKVIYSDGVYNLSLYMEMGGYDCLFYLNIPNEEKWEKVTEIPLESRTSILQYIAEETNRTQCSNCYFEIRSNEIAFYRETRKKGKKPH
jgi:hypothetical protein